jgi:phospholipid-binding lipoprotein MlaA
MLKNFLITLSIFLFLENKAFATNLGEEKLTANYSAFENEDDFETYEESNISEIKDPFEKYNRQIFAFNDTFDKYFLEYVARAYRDNLPKPVRNVVRNFLTNLSLPISSVNSALQGKTENTMASFSYFLINSTIGIGGLFDVAGEKSIRYNQEDFGQTLGHYGVGSGIYIMFPFLGPSSGRDFGGMIFDKSINPMEFNFLEIGGERNFIDGEIRSALAATSGIDKREALLDLIEDVRKDSFDPYSTLRSAYIQKRNSEIKK